MTYAIRLNARLDGKVTFVQGLLVARPATAAMTGSLVTSDADEAMRFRRPQDAERYLNGLSSSGFEADLKQLASKYMVEVVRARSRRFRWWGW
jgi:hypothetical protein